MDLKNLQMVYDVLMDGVDAHPEWDRLIGVSAVGSAIDRIRELEHRVTELGYINPTNQGVFLCTN